MFVSHRIASGDSVYQCIQVGCDQTTVRRRYVTKYSNLGAHGSLISELSPKALYWCYGTGFLTAMTFCIDWNSTAAVSKSSFQPALYDSPRNIHKLCDVWE